MQAKTMLELVRSGWQAPQIPWVGTLVGVVVEASSGTRVQVPVQRRALGVFDGVGLVTASSKDSLGRGLVDARPVGGQWLELHAVLYDRWRQEYGTDKWRHRTPGAQVLLLRPPVSRLATVHLQAPRERLCTHLPGEFLCSSQS